MTQEPKIFPYIERLLQGDEVVWKPLGEVCKVLRGKRLTKKELSDEGIYPVFHGGLIPLGYYNSYNRKGNQTMVINTGSIGEVVWSGVDFWSSDGTFVVETNDVIEDKFLYYYLKTKEQYLKSQKREGGVPTIDRSVVEKLSIPLPPLSVQQEIVRILDKFTQLEAELEAELDCRKRQYEYYRNNLLSYEGNEVEWKTLGEVGEIRMCKRILKEQTSDYGEVPFYKIGTFGKEADAYISKELFNEYRAKYNYPNVGDILISASGTIGRTVIFDGKEAYFQDSNIVWIENDQKKVLNKYLFYYYQIAKWNISEGGTILRLYNENLRKTLIPIPYPNNPKKSLEEQNRIVAILDKFDTLVNSISEGLPKEIALRRKQYEYYREKLLTFINNQ
ncbi:restriction endonuclease subunit S [Capnocytophaga sp.]